MLSTGVYVKTQSDTDSFFSFVCVIQEAKKILSAYFCTFGLAIRVNNSN